MLDQSFSADNFRKILDYVNRKGLNLADIFFPKVKKITDDIKKCNREIRAEKKLRNEDKIKLKELYEKKKNLKVKRSEQLEKELNSISKRILDKKFRIQLKKIEIKGGKDLYTVDNVPEYYLTIKQLQYSISKLYKVKQANRYSIVNQLKTLLGDKFPKFVIRTDIKECYESIPHKALFKKITEDSLLTFFSKKIISQIIEEYKTASKSDKGLPRGIGISAYLAELYLRKVDEFIKSIPDLVFYARYVDDIVAIFSPSNGEDTNNYIDDKFEEIEKKITDVKDGFGLTLNQDKTGKYNLMNSLDDLSIEYLGYKIFFEEGILQLDITDKKINKYKRKIDLIFEKYQRQSLRDEKNARSILVKRIRFLTGNTRLRNNKSNIMVGIFYSNNLLTKIDSIKALDIYLEDKKNRIKLPTRARNRIDKYSFVEGFNNKRFSPFKATELEQIVSIWKKQL